METFVNIMPIVMPVSPPDPPSYIETNHVLHMLLTFFTCGFWGIVWIGVHVGNQGGNRMISEKYKADLAEYQRYQAEMTRYQHDMRVYYHNHQPR